MLAPAAHLRDVHRAERRHQDELGLRLVGAMPSHRAACLPSPPAAAEHERRVPRAATPSPCSSSSPVSSFGSLSWSASPEPGPRGRAGPSFFYRDEGVVFFGSKALAASRRWTAPQTKSFFDLPRRPAARSLRREELARVDPGLLLAAKPAQIAAMASTGAGGFGGPPPGAATGEFEWTDLHQPRRCRRVPAEARCCKSWTSTPTRRTGRTPRSSCRRTSPPPSTIRSA